MLGTRRAALGVIFSLMMGILNVDNSVAAEKRQQAISISYVPGVEGIQLVRVRLRPDVSATFALDTGVSASCITDTMVARLGLKPQPLENRDKTPTRANRHRPTKMVILPSLELGSSNFQNVSLLVVEADEIRRVLGVDIDGFIGINFLKNFVLLLDFQRHQVTLWRSSHFSQQERRQIGMGSAVSIPLKETKDLHFTVPVSVNGITTQELVDTGSTETTISTELAQMLKLTPFYVTANRLMYSDEFHDAAAPTNAVAVGGFVWHNAVVHYSLGRSLESLSALGPVLGLDFLARHRVLLDYPQHRMYFQPVPQQAFSIAFQTPTLGVPLFNLTLKDGKSHLFVLDTSMRSCISTDFARSLAKSSVISSGQQIETSLRFDTTPLAYAQATLNVADAPVAQTAQLNVVGSIGYDILSCYAIRLDFVKKQFDLIAPGHLEGTPYIPKDARRVPLILTDDGYAIQMDVDGQPSWFTIYVNSTTSALRSRTLVTKLQPVSSVNASGADGATRAIRLHQIQIADLIWKSPELLDSSTSEDMNTNALGTDFLRQYIVVMDLPDQALYLAPNPAYVPPKPSEEIGIDAGLDDDGKLVVNAVKPASKAEAAGVQAGDELVSVNGIAVTLPNMDKVSAEMKQAGKKEIILVVKRKGEREPRTFHLKPTKQP